MQRLDDVSFDKIVQFLTIREFFVTSQISKNFNTKLKKYKTLKRPFFIMMRYSDRLDEFVKLNIYDLPLSYFTDFEKTPKLWKSQELAITILKSHTNPCRLFHMIVVPFMFKDCVNVKKSKISLVKYDKLLIEEAIESNDLDNGLHFLSSQISHSIYYLTKILCRHQFCKEYMTNEDMYLKQFMSESKTF
jgi:hypothetical protein